MFLGFEILGDGPNDGIGWFCDVGWGKIGWLSEVSSFLMGFLENNHVSLTLFSGQTHFAKLYMDICFLKSVVLWPYHILLCMKSASYLVLHLGKCMNCWYGKMSIFYLIFDKEIMDFMAY